MKVLPIYLDFDFGDEARELYGSVSIQAAISNRGRNQDLTHHHRIDEVIRQVLAGISHRMDDIRRHFLLKRWHIRGSRASG